MTSYHTRRALPRREFSLPEPASLCCRVCCSAQSHPPLPGAGVSALPPVGDGCLLVFTGLPLLPVQPYARWPPGLPTPYCEHSRCPCICL